MLCLFVCLFACWFVSSFDHKCPNMNCLLFGCYLEFTSMLWLILLSFNVHREKAEAEKLLARSSTSSKKGRSPLAKMYTEKHLAEFLAEHNADDGVAIIQHM